MKFYNGPFDSRWDPGFQPYYGTKVNIYDFHQIYATLLLIPGSGYRWDFFVRCMEMPKHFIRTNLEPKWMVFVSISSSSS